MAAWSVEAARWIASARTYTASYVVNPVMTGAPP